MGLSSIFDENVTRHRNFSLRTVYAPNPTMMLIKAKISS
jgi:hypothetical protein